MTRLSAIFIMLGVISTLFACRTDADNSLQNRINDEQASLSGSSTITVNLDDTPAFSVEFERVQSFPGSNILAVDASERVYLGSTKRVHVFAPDGEELGKLGAGGAGPGEFQSIGAVTPVVSSEKIYVLAPDLQRINVYSQETLQPVHTIMLNPNLWMNIDDLAGSYPASIHALSDTTLLVGFKERGTSQNSNEIQFMRYYAFNVNSGEMNPNKVMEHRDTNESQGIGVSGFMSNAAPRVPYTRQPIMTVSDRGTIYTAWDDEFIITVTDGKGALLYSMQSYYPNSHLDREDIYGIFSHDKRQLDAVREYDMPDTWPALDQILVDDENRLWISTITDDEEKYSWWVIDEEGVFVAKFTWPGRRLERHVSNKSVLKIDNGYLYAYETEEDSIGYNRYVVKYRFDLTEK